MLFMKRITEYIVICEICQRTSIMKIDNKKIKFKLHKNFENEHFCKECYNSTLEEKKERFNINSLEIDYYYR
jgi:hypothetical protein